ncbi:ABC transporter substrate-binding protein [Natronolimnobius sp. AArcel1]|uniref:ABC transporter substrate-binding protein n=1 Tax=Natronolimnobius sp. AArcel1 TaxID=1679093 RepID=UPI0013ED52D4|nr:ABC transporter substrate-binding protein [Natronolimnobius sp. AArcel1]NGM71476.1 ABC transporter substrate-binding protein [Natronolimnobius sp. AArcel1]
MSNLLSTARSADDAGTSSLSRRTMLAATAGTTVSLSGCIRQFRSAVNRDGYDPLSLTITTLPADGDRESIQLSRAIRNVLETAGIDVSIDMRADEEFRRSILINHDYDLYVGAHPGDTDPAFLYDMLHSQFAEEAGWQNPFGLTNLTVDDRLETQRTAASDERAAAVTETLEAVAMEQPFVPICAPTEYRVARTDRVEGWGADDRHPATKHGYLGLETTADTGDDPFELRAAHTDARPSQNLNPLSVEYRDRGLVVDLVYDSLALESATNFETQMLDSEGAAAVADGEETAATETPDEDDAADDENQTPELVPWLAADWEWDDQTLLITLREDCQFHDGEPLTASDVAFTYEFLADTTLGADGAPAPTPRYRGQVDAIDAIELDDTDDYHLEITVSASQIVGERVLTVPILPEHIWRERASAPSVPGMHVAPGTTDALVTDNVPPIGSGPFAFESRTDREHVTFERFDDHFTLRDDVSLPEPTVEEFRIQIDPRSTSALTLVEDGDADVTTTPLESYVVDDVLEETGDDVAVLESSSWSFYHLGFNTRRAPFGNPNFRRTVAQLLDKEWLVESVFDGHARPIATPVTDEWTPDSLAWDGDDPETPFAGTDGDVDGSTARALFEDAGFSYDTDGNLRVRD